MSSRTRPVRGAGSPICRLERPFPRGCQITGLRFTHIEGNPGSRLEAVRGDCGRLQQWGDEFPGANLLCLELPERCGHNDRRRE